jgi:hypothetical protein
MEIEMIAKQIVDASLKVHKALGPGHAGIRLPGMLGA